MLECNVWRAEESDEVGMESAIGLVPYIVERRIVLGRYYQRGTSVYSPFEDRLPRAAALLP